MNVGIIGCGNISDIYIENCKRFDEISVVACADIDEARAAAKAEQREIAKGCSVEELLADPEIQVAVDLTPPQAHYEIGSRVLESGKHLYSEKPLALNREEGKKLLDVARARGVRVGCAPDTFMGAAIQTGRKVLDAGELGRPVAATAFMMCRGHESWHPDPDFFYQQGGGPVFDMGPYYITALVSLLGPVVRVTGSTQTTFPERVIQSEEKKGQRITVNTPTHVSATLEFECELLCTMIMSFDVWHHHLPPLEIGCVDGTLSLPDPNNFDGIVRMRSGAGKGWRKIACTHGYNKNSRGVGLADMVRAIRVDRPHRANGEMAYHVLDIMESIYDAARLQGPVQVTSRCEKPQRMPQQLAFGQMDD